MTQRGLIALTALFLLAACGGSDDAAPDVPGVDDTDTTVPTETDTQDPANGDQPENEPAPTDGDCPYLTEDALTAAIGKDATLTLGDPTGCQWSFPDGSAALLQRFEFGYYDDRADAPNYLGDIDGITGRWGNANAMVRIDEFTLLFNGPVQSPPLRDEMQAVGQAIAAAN